MPTQTYTPTASWNNTSQYQQNGDVADATIAQLTGQDALDNVAYLTGGNTNTQVRQLATVVDLADLKALTSQRDQDYFVLDSNKREYQFDSGSSATGDDYSVVQPTTGGGRYILQSSAVPKSTSKRWATSGYLYVQLDTSGTVARDTTTGHARVTHPNNATLYHSFGSGQFNAGDVISGVEAVLQNGSGCTSVTTVYLVRTAAAGTAPTVTTLATLSGTGLTANITSSSAPLPVTLEAGDQITAVTVLNTSGGSGGTTSTVVWVALVGTRSYITE